MYRRINGVAFVISTRWTHGTNYVKVFLEVGDKRSWRKLILKLTMEDFKRFNALKKSLPRLTLSSCHQCVRHQNWSFWNSSWYSIQKRTSAAVCGLLGRIWTVEACKNWNVCLKFVSGLKTVKCEITQHRCNFTVRSRLIFDFL